MAKDYFKTLPQFLLPKRLLTNFAGLMANVKAPLIKNYLIQRFIANYAVDMSEALEENPLNYACFNDFFIRQLKPEKRPLAAADIISPVDGIISECGIIENGQILQAKGRYYTVEELLAGDKSLTDQFMQGRFITIYLSPKDYHRVHMPINGALQNMMYVPGKLFSVQPTTARVVKRLFARNERLAAFFATEAGLMAMVMVGAAIVGNMATQWHGEIKRVKAKMSFDYQNQKTCLVKGDEMGYFKLGSTVVLLFANGEQVKWLDEITPGNRIKYGQALGKIIK